ncbi:MAG: universal stress protein [Lysobacterales bacterium]
MRRFRKLLVVPATLTMSDPALQRAIKLARSSDATLTILWAQDAGSDGGTGIEYFPEVMNALQNQLNNLTAEVEALHPGRVFSSLEEGKILLEVMRCVQNDSFDLVLKTARGNLSGRRALFGSDASHLLRKCPVPVWIIDSHRQEDSAVLVAIDPMASEPDSKALTQKILQVGSSLSALEGVDLHVVHAWESPNDRIRRSLSWLTPALVDKIPNDEAIGKHHEGALNAAIAPFRAEYPKMGVHLVRGSAEEQVPKLAFEINAGTLVMATMARSGLPGLLIGNTAEVIINDTNRSVLVVKPDDFQTPLTVPPR